MIETIDPNHPEHLPVDQMRELTASDQRVIKTHYRCNSIEDLETASAQHVSELIHDSKKIYVVRNGLDVMASLYEFRRGHDERVKELSFSDFIREPSFDTQAGEFDKVTYWAHHVTTWLDSSHAKDMLTIRFEDWVNQYKQTIKQVGKFIDLRSDWLKTDVRIASQTGKKNAKIERTWVEPRKGKIGDHANYFSPDDYEYFFRNCGDLMSRLGYEK